MSFTVPHAVRHEAETVKGSRFIVDVAPVDGEDHARALLARVASDYGDASHHCSAWRLASPAIERANDDGEPSGSAGRPILAQLAGRDLVDTAVIVTRYFGGTKLGVGGLVRAYGGAAGQALDTLTLVPWVAMTTVSFEHAYPLTDAIERAVTATGGTVIDRTFGTTVQLDVTLPVETFESFAGQVADLTAGQILLQLDV